MTRKRDPRRNKAFEIFRKANGDIKNREIAEQLNLSEKTIGSWKSKDKWNQKMNGVLQSNERSTSKKDRSTPNKKGAPKGNQNAVGNRGNSRASPPQRNKNALKTGEHETIFKDLLSEEEKDIYSNLSDDPFFVLSEEIKLLKIRQRRMMQRIKNAEEGLDQEEIERLQQLRKVKEPTVIDGKVVTIKREVLKDVQITRKQFRRIDNILAIEEALTRVSAQLHRAVKHLAELSVNDKRSDLMEVQIQKIKAETKEIGGGSKNDEVEDWKKAVIAAANKRVVKDDE
ncbi:phage terminase small subunit [Enterococcus sp. AZ051]|uniref:phage terminase small subunit n=1 Tax=Enterococcus sp. AZ051 TaxID=2774698 RepID=UPI003D29F2C7